MWRKLVNDLSTLTVKSFKGIALIVTSITGTLLFFFILYIGVGSCMSALGIPRRTAYEKVEQNELKMDNKQYDELLAKRAKEAKENEARWNALTPEEKAAEEAEGKRVMDELFDNVVRDSGQRKQHRY
ncbi:MAG: hypothetical protein IH577_03140 [Deltaproteobacteria bacterium]|nr:hypothetical protein [Deltaproteobacteria bacterium]